MKSITKIMLAAALLAGSGSATFAHTATVISKNANSTEDRHLSGFNAVTISGSYDVFIVQGSTESVKVEAPEKVIGRIITEVKDGVLKVYSKNESGSDWSWGNNAKMVIYISAKDLNSITMAGSGDIYFKEGIKTKTLALKVAGSGDIFGKVDVETLESSISGSGDIKVSGRATSSSVKVVGSGDFTGSGLTTVNTVVKVAGSGDARVHATQKVDAAVVGSGDVYYTGGAKNVSTSTTGSGDIHGN